MSPQEAGPPGTVAVMFSSDAARYSAFTSDLEALLLPEGSVKDFAFGPDACALRNELVERAIARGSYWIWFITEDHSFEPEIVATMLSRNQAIVAPIVLSRTSPFYPESWAAVGRGGDLTPLLLSQVTGPGTMLEIIAASTNGMLIRRAVFEAMPGPWFRKESGDESVAFCTRARDVGFQAYVDTSQRLGNRLTASMFPAYKAGRWELSVAVGDEIEMSVPIKH